MRVPGAHQMGRGTRPLCGIRVTRRAAAVSRRRGPISVSRIARGECPDFSEAGFFLLDERLGERACW